MEPTEAPFAKLRLDGPRFIGGRLPISALQELERYERLIRDVAAAEWRNEHPDRVRLPGHFKASFSLAIKDVEIGSATPVLERESADTAFESYYERASESVEDAFQALISGTELPASFDWPSSSDFRDFGNTLDENDAIEFRPGTKSVVRYTSEIRREVAPRLIEPVSDLLELPDIKPGWIAGRLVALDVEARTFRVLDPANERYFTGSYANDALEPDLRKVLDSSASAPVVRLAGEIGHDGNSDIVDAHSVELFELDGNTYSRRLIELATLLPGWSSGRSDAVSSGELISFSALEAARDILRDLSNSSISSPGIFPMEDGGVQIEWASTDSVASVEIDSDLSFVLFTLDAPSRETQEEETSDLTAALTFLRRVIIE